MGPIVVVGHLTLPLSICHAMILPSPNLPRYSIIKPLTAFVANAYHNVALAQISAKTRVRRRNFKQFIVKKAANK